MEIRQALNENRGITLTVTGLLTLVAIVFVLRSVFAADGPSGGKAFYTVDDGAHWFVDSASNIPPFQHDGKPAYRAMVYRCKSDGTEFVAYLERYSDADRKRLAEIDSNKVTGAGPMELIQLGERVEVKKPGDREWLRPKPQNAAEIQELKQPHCPKGAEHELELVVAR